MVVKHVLEMVNLLRASMVHVHRLVCSSFLHALEVIVEPMECGELGHLGLLVEETV